MRPLQHSVIFLIALFLPTIALAQFGGKNLGELVNSIGAFVNLVFIPLALGVAVVFFFWRLLNYVAHSREPKTISEGNTYIFWGIIGLAVFVGVLGLISLALSFFGIDRILLPFLKTPGKSSFITNHIPAPPTPTPPSISPASPPTSIPIAPPRTSSPPKPSTPPNKTEVLLPPSNLRATNKIGFVLLEWSASPTANISNYLLERDDVKNGKWESHQTFLISPNETSYKDTSVSLGKIYDYRISAERANPKGQSDYTNATGHEFKALALPPPENFIGVFNGSNPTFSWQAIPDNQKTADFSGYRFYVQEVQNGKLSGSASAINLSSSQTSYTPNLDQKIYRVYVVGYQTTIGQQIDGNQSVKYEVDMKKGTIIKK